MESKAKLAGHAAHPILVVFPLGLLATSVIFDGVYLLNKNQKMVLVAYWMITAGLISGFAAAIPGWIDWLAIPAYTRVKRIGLFHGVGNVVVLLLFGASWLWRTGEPGYQPPALALISSGLAFMLTALTGWLGGELVDRLGVGIDDNANLNAPNLLSGHPAANPSTSHLPHQA
ncbi:DUF2231 domain-containing protein [Spirosoma sp. BT702]|uniref:DUF2231 domain-containing protein n=1 Tax=Spirosoma profusum TaxID=2771354 RepID=A0A927G9Y5_9BACT|nr:DUF2231 domain-containing protein [Spirosoma profusum]MBD2705097.1 DUF2231 domain-containing protein [Spirosoma profusum]